MYSILFIYTFCQHPQSPSLGKAFRYPWHPAMDSACDVGHLVNALAKRPFDALVFGCDRTCLRFKFIFLFLLTFADSPILGLSPESSGLPCPHCRRTRILAISVLRISKARIVSIQTLLYMLLSLMF